MENLNFYEKAQDKRDLYKNENKSFILSELISVCFLNKDDLPCSFYIHGNGICTESDITCVLLDLYPDRAYVAKYCEEYKQFLIIRWYTDTKLTKKE